jgi:hypothetical protein
MLTLTGTLLATSGCATTTSTADRPFMDRVLHPFGHRSAEEGYVVGVSPPVEGPALGDPPTMIVTQPARQNGSLILDNNVPPLAAPPNGRLEPKAQPIPYVP